MTDDSESRSDDFRRIMPMVDDLFDQADPTQAYGDYLESDDDICPLYCAITRITDRYQNPTLIGRGGMKEVYRVHDARAARHVAMAKPLPEFSSDQYDAFLREAHLTARLDHPNIIDLFDMDVDEQGRPFFTMQLKHGRSLREVIHSLKKKKPDHEDGSLRRRLEIFSRVCDAVAYAHSRRVLHLDIKPGNIFVGEFGEVKLCDWGMGVVMKHEEGQDESAVLLDPDLYGSLLESAKGTPVYMAPEQMDKRQRKTQRMDVYALGCLLQELLTLQLPTEPMDSDSRIDLALAATISKARAPDPVDRYQTVDALREDISCFLSGYSTSVQRPSLRREAALFYRRHREACTIALGLLGLLALCVTFFVLQLRDSREQALSAKSVAVTARGRSQEAQARALRAQASAVQAQEKTKQALVRAEDAKVESEKEKARAEKSLAMYLAKKKESEKRRNRQVRAADSYSQLLTDSGFLRDGTLPEAIKHTHKHLDSILSFDPPPESPVWNKKFWLLFVTQQFDLALELVRDGKVIDSDLVRMAQLNAPNRNEDGRLTTKQLVLLVGELSRNAPWRAPLAEKMLIYDSHRGRSPADQAYIVENWLRINNPNWKDQEIDFDAETKTVRLRGSGLVHFVRTIARSKYQPSRVCLLHTLEAKVLDLRETGIRDLSGLSSLSLLELDLRQTPVTDLSPLYENRTLRRLIIDPDQFSDSQLAGLPSSIDVILSTE